MTLNRRQFLSSALLGAGFAGKASGPLVAQATSPLRYSCFYQVDRNAVDIYADVVSGLPNDPWHVHVFAHSHASVYADPNLAAYIHNANSRFAYAPAFDLHKFAGWRTADESQLAAWGRDFRDNVLSRGADYFAFNELPTNSGTDAQTRANIATLLRYLNEPDADGHQLPGIFFMTHAPSMPANWNDAASEFWQTVDATCALVVAEHYHGNGFICQNSETFLSNHFFAMYNWLNDSGEYAKISIANDKFTVLHSSRYGPGSSGWQGANSDVVPFDVFQRDLGKCARVTRNAPGGTNRISFAPLAAVYTDPAVHSHISLLLNWHYNQDFSADEQDCLGGDPANCAC